MRNNKDYRRTVTQNLIQFGKMPPERHRKLSSKGGKASGEVRCKKKALKEAVQITLEYCVEFENLSNEFDEFLKWKKRRDKARANRERTKKKAGENF